MSDTIYCEKSIDAESFISELATESAELVVKELPVEYRNAYLSTYAASLALNQLTKTNGEVNV